MPASTYKVAELVGTSDSSWEDSGRNAVQAAGKPPICSRSITAVFHPERAIFPASGPPPWPVPITIASYVSGFVMVSCL